MNSYGVNVVGVVSAFGRGFEKRYLWCVDGNFWCAADSDVE